MTDGFVVLPKADRFALTHATLPSVTVEGFQAQAKDGLVSADIVIANGMIEAVLPAGSAPSDMPQADLRDGMIFPCFVDMHTHLDKGHVWDRRPNPMAHSQEPSRMCAPTASPIGRATMSAHV